MHTAFLIAHRWTRGTLEGVRGPFRALLRHYDLIRLLIKRDIAIRTSGTALGGLWMVAQPALQVAAFWFLLGVVLQVRFPGATPFVDYFLISMIPWLMISDVMGRSLSVLNDYSALYRRTPFPLVILPLLPLLISGVIYGLVYTLIVALMEGGKAVLVPFLMLGLMLWMLPFCYLLAVMGLFFKDAIQAFPVIITLILYMTPILYMPQMLPEGIRAWLIINPFADLIAILHGAFQGMTLSWSQVLRPWIIWLFMLAPAWILFCRSEPHVREVL